MKLTTQLIELLETKGKIFISSERPLPPKFEKYRLKVNPLHMPHILSFAEIFVGDSQTMTSEAAVLGIPSFRCNDFVGKLSVMEEKEYKYHLSFNYSPDRFHEMLAQIRNILNNPSAKDEFRKNREKMLSEKIDLSNWLSHLLENFPVSKSKFKYI